jgi:phage tail-like protein
MTMIDRATAELAVTTCFAVSIDGKRLGSFSSCEGLGCEVVMEQREEGGSNGFIWQLPTRIKYSNIKLSRAVCADTVQVGKK